MDRRARRGRLEGDRRVGRTSRHPVIGRLFDPILRREWKKNLEWGKRQMEKKPDVEKATA